MINKIKMILTNKVFQNGAWLYVLQFYNMIIPILTLPYITRVLGSSHYGMFSFSLTLVTYFQVATEYGFNLSGSRKVALTTDSQELSRVFTRITFSKIFLCIISFIVMLIISLLIDLDRVQFICLLILYTIVLGSSIQQVWLFQGLQVMKYITIINLVSRTVSVALIFIFVSNSKHVYLYCGLYAVTSLLNGVISSILVRFKLKIHLQKINMNDIINELKDGWYTFTTSAMSTVFTGIGITVLGLSNIGNSMIGIYSAIQKIPYIMIMLYAPIGQAIFPYISNCFSIGFENGMKFIKKILKIAVPMALLITLLLIINCQLIVNILYGEEYSSHAFLLIPLAGWLFFSIINNLIGVQILVAGGYLKEYSAAFRISVVAIIVLNISLGVKWDAYGVAIASLISEFILTISIYYKIRNIKKLTLKKALVN